jgi:hypothetical protein
MLTIPDVTPVTTPLAAPTVAIAAFALLHTPPGTLLVSVTGQPAHPVAGPAIEAGTPLTVTSAVVIQLVLAAV